MMKVVVEHNEGFILKKTLENMHVSWCRRLQALLKYHCYTIHGKCHCENSQNTYVYPISVYGGIVRGQITQKQLTVEI